MEQPIVNIRNLVSDEHCYETVRQRRWPEGVQCPHCDAQEVIRRGYDENHVGRQRYQCIAIRV